jgi:Flp pilus assembly protein TadB
VRLQRLRPCDAKRKVHATQHTDALEQKINARAVFALPWLVLLLLTARPGHFRDFYQSTGGLLVVGAAAVLSAVGVVLVTRLGRDPVEERVLAGSTPTSAEVPR